MGMGGGMGGGAMSGIGGMMAAGAAMVLVQQLPVTLPVVCWVGIKTKVRVIHLNRLLCKHQCNSQCTQENNRCHNKLEWISSQRSNSKRLSSRTNVLNSKIHSCHA